MTPEEERLTDEVLTLRFRLLTLRTLEAEHERVMLHREDEGGTICRGCDKRAMVYPTELHSNLGRALILFYRQYGSEYGPLFKTVRHVCLETTKFQHWGFIEKQGDRADDGNTSGMWRVTEDGRRWVKGITTTFKRVLIYERQIVRFELPGWSIEDSLGKNFNYRDLWRTA